MKKKFFIITFVVISFSIILGIYVEYKFNVIPKFRNWYGATGTWEVKKVDVATWLGSLSTLVAATVAVIQVIKQTNITRALNTEDKRPRFAVEMVTKFRPNSVIVYNQNWDSKKLLAIGKRDNINCVGIRNISSNLIYSMKVLLSYEIKSEKIENKKVCFEYPGLLANQEINLLLDEMLDPKWNDKIHFSAIDIEFRSSGDEIGFYHQEHKDKKEQYYFVKNSNHQIKVSGNDILVNTKKAKKFDNDFNVTKFNKYWIW